MLVGFTGTPIAADLCQSRLRPARDFVPISAIDRVQSVLLVNPTRLDVSALQQFSSRRAQAGTRSTCVRRARHDSASGDRAAADPCGREAAPRALSRRRAGAAGPAMRPGRRHVRHGGSRKLRQGRQASRACCRRPPARGLVAGGADVRRGRTGGFRAISGTACSRPRHARAGARPHARGHQEALGSDRSSAMGRAGARRARSRASSQLRARTARAGAPSSRRPASSRSDQAARLADNPRVALEV